MIATQAVLARAGWSSTRPWWMFSVACLGIAIHLLADSPAVSTAVIVLVAGAALGSVVVGMWRHRPTAATSWLLLLACGFSFACGAVLRQVDAASDAPASFVPDVLTFLGYALATVAALAWLRTRYSAPNPTLLLDTALVSLSALLVSWTFLMSPTMPADGGVDARVVVDALYPVADVVILTIIAHSIFVCASADTPLRLVQATFTAVFLGDLGYALDAAGVIEIDTRLLLAPFLVAYGTLGAAALHPAMLTVAEPVTDDRTTRTKYRVAVVASVLLVASAVPAFTSSLTVRDRFVLPILLGLLLFGVLLRSERAIRRSRVSEEHARFQATHDLLTGLRNRSLLREDKFWDPAGTTALSLLFLDFDDFKLVNDSYGHRTGDELIAAVAARIRACLGPRETAARYGGDEFLVLAQLDRVATDAAAERLVALFAEPFELSVGRVFVTASIGVATADGPPTPALMEDLIREADSAMYHAKRNSRGGYAFFDRTLRSAARAEIETATALRDALTDNNFVVHYQPIVMIGSERVVGYEALVRWKRDGHLMPPLAFIPIAESTNLIVALGAWVLDEAVAQLAQWNRRAETPLVMSINVSARQLTDGRFGTTVADALARHAVPASALWIELTESVLIEDTPSASRTIGELRELGVRLCIDDFGTGYSALSYLERFPIDVVKIDRSFVTAGAADTSRRAIVVAIEAMSRALGIDTIAEGIETDDQETMVREIGCVMAQGFRYGHPRPPEDIVVA